MIFKQVVYDNPGRCRRCERVRVGFKAAPPPRSHLLDSSCLNTTQAPVRVRETPRYNSTSVFRPSQVKKEGGEFQVWHMDVTFGNPPKKMKEITCVGESTHLCMSMRVHECACVCVCGLMRLVHFVSHRVHVSPRGALAPAPPGRM